MGFLARRNYALANGRFKVIVFYTGFSKINNPDIHIGRANADFGQGFYLSGDEAFSKRWAGERKGLKTYLNRYELADEGLKIKRLSKDMSWYDYILGNRNGLKDRLSEYDVIIGPIANDTIYDTWGMLTGGLIDRETALRVLQIGPVYEQIVIKSEKAASALRFISSQVLSHEEIEGYRCVVKAEGEAFQEAFGQIIEEALPKMTN